MTILANKELFLAHLARRLEAMEQHLDPLQAVAYRLYARRLRAALAGYPPARLPHTVRSQTMAEALEDRFFAEHGRLPGHGGRAVKAVADDLLKAIAAL